MLYTSTLPVPGIGNICMDMQYTLFKMPVNDASSIVSSFMLVLLQTSDAYYTEDSCDAVLSLKKLENWIVYYI